MGLDSYLYCNSRTLTSKVIDEIGVNPSYADSDYDWTSFFKQYGAIGYWRKTWAIHNWFVEHVQRGEDDCKTYPVRLDDLIELRERCQRAIDYPASAEIILPTPFGMAEKTTEYAKWYLFQLVYTVNLIDSILDHLVTNEDNLHCSPFIEGEEDWRIQFYYHASW